METKVLNAHVPLPLAQKLDAIAAQLDLPPERIVADAIAAWIDREEEQRLAELRHILAASAIIVVEQHRVIDWADSLSADRR
jgi:predicted transcriptional regulator